MKYNKQNLFLFFLIFIFDSNCLQEFKWAVIGAGPAGIESVAVLIENGICEKDIVWIDPEFKVGRLGKYYGNVPSNQKAYKFIDVLTTCSIFNKVNPKSLNALLQYGYQKEPNLQFVVDPLQEITEYLLRTVPSFQDSVISIDRTNKLWELKLANFSIFAHKVIIATGCRPKKFDFKDITEIPLDLALDKCKLKGFVKDTDTVMVIGSAHSALLILKYLSEISVKRVINIFCKPPSYGQYGGLEGITAWWTKEVLEKNCPKNIERVLLAPGIVEKLKKECTKIIYAFGYESNPLAINGTKEIKFTPTTGKLDTNLYGIGFAYPAQITLPNGTIVPLIGVNSFMKQAREVIPYWINE